jgi:hypothetical protein
MRKLTTLVTAIALLALPVASADAHKRGQGHPGVKQARQACKTERQADPAAFRVKYGNKNGRRAMRRCVRQHVRQAKKNCRAERKQDPAAFRVKYGNQKGRHAMRRCVRQHAGDPVA